MQGVELTISTANGVITTCQPTIHYPNVAAILQGQQASAVQKRLNLIYRQCGQAHNHAFFSAVGYRYTSQQRQAQLQALALESMQELTWQLWRIYQQLFSEHQEEQAFFVTWRQWLMALKNTLAQDLWQEESHAKPIDVVWNDTWLTDWKQKLYQPIKAHIIQHHWAQHLVTPTTVLLRYESGPCVRQNQTQPSILDRLAALWHELESAAVKLTTPDSATLMSHHGEVQAVRGQLTHRILWQDNQDNQVKQYDIDVPTVGVIHSLCQSLIGLPIEKIERSDLALSVWILTHFPCMDVSLHYVETPE